MYKSKTKKINLLERRVSQTNAWINKNTIDNHTSIKTNSNYWPELQMNLNISKNSELLDIQYNKFMKKLNTSSETESSKVGMALSMPMPEPLAIPKPIPIPITDCFKNFTPSIDLGVSKKLEVSNNIESNVQQDTFDYISHQVLLDHTPQKVYMNFAQPLLLPRYSPNNLINKFSIKSEDMFSFDSDTSNISKSYKLLGSISFEKKEELLHFIINIPFPDNIFIKANWEYSGGLIIKCNKYLYRVLFPNINDKIRIITLIYPDPSKYDIIPLDNYYIDHIINCINRFILIN